MRDEEILILVGKAKRFNYQPYNLSVAKEIARSFLNLGFKRDTFSGTEHTVLKMEVETEQGKVIRQVFIGCQQVKGKEMGFFDLEVEFKDLITI